MKSTWGLASSNAGKLREFEQALGPVLAERNIALVNQSSLGIEAAEEPHDCFEQNALAKARHASRLSGHPALADDSGICVPILGGAPGVRSARFFSDAVARADPSEADDIHKIQSANVSIDEANLRWLLRCVWHALGRQPAVTHQPMTEAGFQTVIAFVRFADDPNPLLATGHWSGLLLSAPRGSQGFGYDPIFLDPVLSMTAAEMSLEQKRQVGHRGRALDALLTRLAQ